MDRRRRPEQLMKLHCAILLMAGLLQGCFYDKFEDFKPKSVCDTTKTVGYNQHIKGILERNCYSCHAGSAPSGNVSLDNYNSVRSIAATGKLYSSVIWDGSTVMMPRGSTSKIDECDIKDIRKWIDTNYPQ